MKMGVTDNGRVAHRLDEVSIDRDATVVKAMEAIQYWWNFAKHKDQKLVMELWCVPKEELCSS